MVDVNSLSGMNFKSDTVVTPNPNFVNFRIASVNTTDKLGSVSVPTTRVGKPTKISNWRRQAHYIEESMADRVSEKNANSDNIFKNELETMKEIQDFERENISMSTTPLTRTTKLKEHFTISPQKNGKEHFTISPHKNEKGHVPYDPESDPSLSDSSSKKNKHDNMKNCRKQRNDDESYPSSSEDSNSSHGSDYRRK